MREQLRDGRGSRAAGIKALAAAAAMVIPAMAGAEELPEGFVINAATLDQASAATFEGKPVNELLTDVLRMAIRDFHLEIPLEHSRPLVMPAHWIEATEKYSSEVRYNPETKDVEGYVAGLPFPDINVDDPFAGTKIAWNWFLSPAWIINSAEVTGAGFNLITMDRGYDRDQGAVNNQIRMIGRTIGPPTLGDGSIVKKQIVAVTYPYDVAGFGTFTVKYRSGQVDDVWAYVKSVRRVRRVSGTAWMDPLAGSDLLGDDNYGLDAHPNWYQSWNITSKRWLLVGAHGAGEYQNRISLPIAQRANLERKPYGMPIGVTYEPREIYVLEGTPPAEHPYSRKILFTDVQVPSLFWGGETYDKKNELWKFFITVATECPYADGSTGMCPTDFPWYDIQRLHSSFITVGHSVMSRGDNSEEYTPALLEKAASGDLR